MAGYQVVGFDGPAHGKSDGKNTNLNEFELTIQTIVKHAGNVQAIIAHSFGGAASLYAIAQRPSGKNIGEHCQSDHLSEEIINTFLRAINGSKKTGDAFKKYVLKKYGKNI